LADSAKTLDWIGVNNRPFNLVDSNVPMDWVLDEPPILLGQPWSTMLPAMDC